MTRDTVELACTETGAGDPVVLIMGLGADATAWRQHTDAWSRSFRCIALDNRGAGRSPAPPGPYTTRQLAEDTAALMERLGVGPAAVVGISMGGAIAQELALSRPDLVSRLVLTATWSRPHAYTTSVLRTLGRARAATAPAAFTEHLQTLIWTPGWFAAHESELVAAREVPPAVGLEGLEGQLAACETHDAHRRLGAVTVPTLVTAGTADRFIPADLSADVAEAIPGSTFEPFRDRGHVHHWEELDRYNGLVGDWLAR
jgi:pimeloyl-ACP methyl ester carboxylesterase